LLKNQLDKFRRFATTHQRYRHRLLRSLIWLRPTTKSPMPAAVLCVKKLPTGHCSALYNFSHVCDANLPVSSVS